MFPAKRKRIFMNLFLRNSSCLQRCSILLIFNLLQPGFHCIFQIFLCFRILNLELNNKCIIALISWLQHHIVSSESTLPVRSHNITILQFYNQPQNKWYRRQIYYYFQFFYPASRFRTF